LMPSCCNKKAARSGSLRGTEACRADHLF
jgi:hypothetical protein